MFLTINNEQDDDDYDLRKNLNKHWGRQRSKSAYTAAGDVLAVPTETSPPHHQRHNSGGNGNRRYPSPKVS